MLFEQRCTLATNFQQSVEVLRRNQIRLTLSRVVRLHTSQSALGCVNLLNLSIDPAQVNRLTVGQCIHRLLREVESVFSVVNNKDVDAPASVTVGQLPASAAVGVVVSCDYGSSSNVRVDGEIAECGESRGEAVTTVGAGDGEEGA